MVRHAVAIFPGQPRYFYCTVARVPGRKAHCSQIAQMTRSFVRVGVDLMLLQPTRAMLPDYRGQTIRSFYGFDIDVPTRRLPSIDLVSRMPLWLHRELQSLAYRLLIATFNRSLTAYLRRITEPFLVYSRDVQVLDKVAARFPKVSRFAEIHMLAQGDGALRELERKVLQRCEGVIVVTPQMKELLVDQGIEAENVIVETNAVDPGAFPGTVKKSEARSKLGLAPEVPLVLFVGNFKALGVGRGIDTIVEAIPDVVRTVKDAKFLFVGGPLGEATTFESQLQQRQVPPAHYAFFDRQPYAELHNWLAAADVLVHIPPHHHIYDNITSPLKVFEYMTSGRPIVVSDLPAMRNLLTHERNALFVPPEDPSALTAALVRVLQDKGLATRLSDNARRDVQNNTWDARAGRIRQWIENRVRPHAH